MIKRAQTRFILITMSILFAVFGVIFAVTNVSMRNFTELSIERTLGEAKDGFLAHGEEVVFHNGIAVVISYNPIIDDYFFNYTYDKNVFTEKQVNDFIDYAIKRPYYSGKTGNVYYRLYALDQTETKYLLIAADMSDTLALFKRNTLNSFFLLTAAYLVLFYIVFRLSFRVFQPIKESFDKQKQFISNASHELKTPLTVISANADVLKQSGDNQWISNIHSQTERMDALVADMLTLAKMDEGKMSLNQTEFNLSEEITSSALPFDAVAFEKGKMLELEIADNIVINGDVDSVKKIVNILLDNAVKHASNGGTIKVSLKKESSRIALSVFNTGSLVPAEDSNKVFERFYRGDKSRARESGGSGLGLAIARGIADANKWKISADSVLGVSMTITVVFK